MANYNFKKEAQVWFEALTDAGSVLHPVKLDVSNISFNQTFTDKTYSQKTIHNSDYFFDQSNITTANPASFEFKLNVIETSEFNNLYKALLEANKFNLYIRTRTNGHVYKLTTCIATSGKFLIEKLETLALTFSGEAAKLSVLKGNQAANANTLLANNGITPNSTYQRVESLVLKFITPGTDTSFIDLTDGLIKTSVEIQNDVKWTPYTTLNDALNVTDETNSMYPSNFTVSKKIISGSISTYVNDSTSDDDVQTWNQHNAQLRLTAGSYAGGYSPVLGFQFSLDNCTFTNRVNVDEVFTQNFDWKFNGDPTQTDLTQLIKFNNTTV